MKCSPRSRFLPIRSKKRALNIYEQLRHPSNKSYIDIWELYKYIKCPSDIFLNATPAIFFTNKASTKGPLEHMGIISPRSDNKISYHPKFLAAIKEPRSAFISCMSLLIYDEKDTPIEFHMTPIIVFPGANPKIHIVDVARNPSNINAELEELIKSTLGSNLDLIYITDEMLKVYGLDLNLQKDEVEGYCTTWTAGMIEILGRCLRKLETKGWDKQLEFYRKFYKTLMLRPNYGRNFYNKLCMRTHGWTRRGQTIIGYRCSVIPRVIRAYLCCD